MDRLNRFGVSLEVGKTKTKTEGGPHNIQKKDNNDPVRAMGSGHGEDGMPWRDSKSNDVTVGNECES